MRIGIVSDTHNRREIVAKALELLRAHNVELIVHCGDIEDADTIRLFAGVPTHFVFGNCDTNREALRRAMREIQATCHEPFGDLELAGHKIAFLHGDNRSLFHELEQGERFEYLFYGHTHEAREHRTGPTRVINPGALHRARPKKCAVLDLASGELAAIVVE